MSDVDKAVATQLANIEKRSGKTLGDLAAIVRASGLAKFGEVREMLIRDVGLSYGDANALTKHVLAQAQAAAGTQPPTIEEYVAGYYAGAKAALRPIHDKVMAEVAKFGEFEVAPKKTYLSLRRNKQFAMVGPATNTRVEVGLNVKGLTQTDRLIEMPAGSMCNYTVRLTTLEDVDDALIAWLKQAYDSAG